MIETLWFWSRTLRGLDASQVARETRMALRSPGILMLVLLAPLALQACAATLARNPVPEKYADQAHVTGLENIRYWGDAKPENLDRLIEARRAELRASATKRQRAAKADFLALSGGGDNGAFGAGFLAGWTKSGKRPEFDVVTGVSTGVLIAPFAFLGPRYDSILKTIYTRYTAADLISVRPLGGLITGRAVADNSGLASLIVEYVDQALLEAIAHEHRSGRRLLVGTTNLDEERPVIWDMGAIAASEQPEALKLFRQVLLASTAIPGVFPPVRIEVSAGGMQREELHVDGGTTTSVFLLPTPVALGAIDNKLGIHSRRRLFIIRNGKVGPEREVVAPRNMAIAARAIWTLTKSQGVGDLYRLYLTSQRDNVDFNLAYIPQKFTDTSVGLFDQVYMNALYKLGYDMSRSGYEWEKSPPGF